MVNKLILVLIAIVPMLAYENPIIETNKLSQKLTYLRGHGGHGGNSGGHNGHTGEDGETTDTKPHHHVAHTNDTSSPLHNDKTEWENSGTGILLTILAIVVIVGIIGYVFWHQYK